MSKPPENTPDYISDNWYLKDHISEKDLKAEKTDELQTTRDLVKYIQENGSKEEQEALLTHEVEFTQKVLNLVQNIRKRKS